MLFLNIFLTLCGAITTKLEQDLFSINVYSPKFTDEIHDLNLDVITFLHDHRSVSKTQFYLLF